MGRPRKQRYLRKHENGRWYVHPDCISTRQTDKAAAEEWLEHFEAGTALAIAPLQPSIDSILDGYKADRKGKVRSYETLKHACNALSAHLGRLSPDEVSQGVIDRYAVERGRKPGTIIRELVTLRAAFRWAIRQKWILTEPRFTMPVKKPKPRQRYLTLDECERLIMAATDHIKIFVLIGLGTGARTRAILDLKWSQVDFGSNLIDFGEGSGNKRRAIVPMGARLRDALEEAKTFAVSDHVIEFNSEPVKSIKKGFAAACRRAGIADATPHTLRHTSASQSLMAGTSTEEVARLLGNTKAEIEATYGHHSPDYLKRAIGWFS